MTGIPAETEVNENLLEIQSYQQYIVNTFHLPKGRVLDREWHLLYCSDFCAPQRHIWSPMHRRDTSELLCTTETLWTPVHNRDTSELLCLWTETHLNSWAQHTSELLCTTETLWTPVPVHRNTCELLCTTERHLNSCASQRHIWCIRFQYRDTLYSIRSEPEACCARKTL